MKQAVTKSEYANHRGCTPGYVTQLGKEGRLVITADGLVDVEASDALVESTRDPARGGDRTGKQAGAARDLEYHAAKTAEMQARAERARLEVERLAGRLVPLEEVETAAFELARRAQETLLSIPDRLSAVIAAETDPGRVRQLLAEEIRRVTEEISAGARRPLAGGAVEPAP